MGWVGLDSNGLDWIGLDWIGLGWIGLDLFGPAQSKLCHAALVQSSADQSLSSPVAGLGRTREGAVQ
eukprot:4345068-Lingulodinium_polyedra.AAC.1